MRRDSRLSGVLHVLLHMAGQGRPVTSGSMASAMRTNPVVIRRLLAGLRERGIVRSAKGHGGGWVLARDPDAITLKDVHEALGRPEILAIGNRTESPRCMVEEAVNAALAPAFREAEAVLIARLSGVTLGALGAALRDRPARSIGEMCHAA